MRAIQVSEPWGIDRIEVVERPEPAPGHGQVLVRMRAVSLNYRDLLMVGGVYSRGPAMAGTITPFSDGCGVVEAVGEGVTRVKPGDRVSTLFFQNWTSGRATVEKLTSALGSPIPGAGAELQVFSQEGVSKVPDFLTDEEVSTLACAGLTAWRGLFEDARLEPGDTVVLQGTGGCRSSACSSPTPRACGPSSPPRRTRSSSVPACWAPTTWSTTAQRLSGRAPCARPPVGSVRTSSWRLAAPAPSSRA
jgi:NADPH:quinone reductase-like Zn-dependent oxidoreductase